MEFWKLVLSLSVSMHPGHAAQSGVLAALLAQGGFTSTNDVLEGKRGFITIMAAIMTSTKRSLILASIGNCRWLA